MKLLLKYLIRPLLVVICVIFGFIAAPAGILGERIDVYLNRKK